MRISDWSSDVCSSDLQHLALQLVEIGIVGPFLQQGVDLRDGLVDVRHPGVGDGAGIARRQALVALRVALQYLAHRRSEEHTSELQSLMRTSYAVFCMKKKNNLSYLTKTETKQIA